MVQGHQARNTPDTHTHTHTHTHSEGSSVANRVLAQLFTEMDGVEMLSDVLVIAAPTHD